MRKKIIVLLIMILMSHGFVFSQEVLKLIDLNIEQILNVIKDPQFKGEDNKDKRREKLSVLLGERFNFIEMAKRSVGKDWKSWSREQRVEFTSLFRKVLEKTYISKIEMYTDQPITMEKETEIGKNKVQVETSIKVNDSDVPIIYRLIHRNNDWKIYDVNIEGVGLVKNYRSQFKEILFKGNYQDLIKKLKQTVEGQ